MKKIFVFIWESGIVFMLLAIAIIITFLYISFKEENRKTDDCGYTIINPGDTIIYRWPNIPKNFRLKHAHQEVYGPELDSIIITYDYQDCK
jgi:hypothetical protein